MQPGNRLHHEGEHHVLKDGQFRDQCVFLEDVPEPGQSEGSPLLIGEAAGIGPVNGDRPAGRPVKEAEQVEERGLPAPARPRHPDELAPLDPERDAPAVLKKGGAS